MKLKNEIYKKGYTITSFCKKTGVDKSTLYKFFEGRTKRFNGYTISQLAKALGKEYEEMLEILEVKE